MAIFGTLDTLRIQLARPEHFTATLAYVAEALQPGSAAQARIGKIAAGTTGRIELDGGAFALEQVYLTKPRTEARWESHRAYIDVQVIVAGEELMEVGDAAQLAVAEDLRPAKDLIFYRPFDGGSVLRVRAGEAAVFFPSDAHLPSLNTGAVAALVRKTVVKVPVWAGC
ncbi:MAG TPA: YhcH/YjgK/YiaL family protein [Opitutaceae bacterium]|jgi:biofilm protein TabA|nr:YhcH/YjgK/YiaL family protein [Opitutaceae bacterium]